MNKSGEELKKLDHLYWFRYSIRLGFLQLHPILSLPFIKHPQFVNISKISKRKFAPVNHKFIVTTMDNESLQSDEYEICSWPLAIECDYSSKVRRRCESVPTFPRIFEQHALSYDSLDYEHQYPCACTSISIDLTWHTSSDIIGGSEVICCREGALSLEEDLGFFRFWANNSRPMPPSFSALILVPASRNSIALAPLRS